MQFENSKSFAEAMDQKDPLKNFRSQFYIPKNKEGEQLIYLTGNSLGLQPKSTFDYINQELLDWEKYGVEGHFHAKNPWMPYHEFLTKSMAEVVGAKPIEVVVMNTLSVNLHLMMVSFYRPTQKRYKILIERDAFPSDRYAVQSQLRFHGYDPNDGLLELRPRDGEETLRTEDILQTITDHGDEIALVMIGNTNYYTGQAFDLKTITSVAHEQGAMVGFDCAHGAGNVVLNLHDSNCDFAVWCSYKYLNSGPGSLGGVFVHERHAYDKSLPRFEGWWGHNKETRFGMRDGFDPIPGVESWQLSNPPILSMAAIMASLKIFMEAGINNLRTKSVLLTGYMEYLVNEIGNESIKIITPSDPEQRGSQLSIQMKNADKRLFEWLTERGVVADWREPDVIRVSAVPMYNSFCDVFAFVNLLKQGLEES